MKFFTIIGVAVVALAATASSIHEELKFYLDRHNVQDEGYDMVVNYAVHGDTMLTQLPDRPLRLTNIGHWRGIKREGIGLERDSAGRVIFGVYEEDTLKNGIRTDTTSRYNGAFANGQANGHGCELTAAGDYYEGQWSADHRSGFGFATGSHDEPNLRVGHWRNGRFLGERMYYTSERIYGIDISRYQHQDKRRPRKKVPILWDQLSVTYLGGQNQQHARDGVDYPVRFVFIKSTESTNIRNPFYHDDYLQARRRGIPVGAYHFYSCKVSGAAQAQHFINHTLFRSGDLPPVLDLEPSPSQIAKMGGAQVLFRHVRTWLTAVERYAKVNPILYVNQIFVNNYLSQAPDLKHDYQIWIARYSEFKPDVRLAVWQLSPYGHVRGIRGSVDINVFNGYESQWQEFLQEMTIK